MEHNYVEITCNECGVITCILTVDIPESSSSAMLACPNCEAGICEITGMGYTIIGVKFPSDFKV